MGRLLSSSERYSQFHATAAGRALETFTRNPAEFARAIVADCFLSHAFQTERERTASLNFITATRLQEMVKLQEPAARGLWQMWLDLRAGKAQTVSEKAVATYLDSIIAEAVDAEAARVAEGDLESVS